jgi:hypothetical protein
MDLPRNSTTLYKTSVFTASNCKSLFTSFKFGKKRSKFQNEHAGNNSNSGFIFGLDGNQAIQLEAEGEKEVNINPNNSNIPYQPTSTSSTPAPGTPQNSLEVTRELDGVNNTGVIGELLTVGTNNLAEANKYFAMGKFAVSGLLAEDNQAVSSKAVISQPTGTSPSKILCDDDMYLAGDPGVGGKGNNYAYQHVEVSPGFYTLFEDGSATGQKITVNAHVEAINPEGGKAFTEYGFIIQDASGAKTKATLSGGQLTIIDANGQTRKLLPPNDVYTVGNPADPTARFYYADVPGAGKDGATEKRLIVDYFEKPSQQTIDELIAKGVNPENQNIPELRIQSAGWRQYVRHVGRRGSRGCDENRLQWH